MRHATGARRSSRSRRYSATIHTASHSRIGMRVRVKSDRRRATPRRRIRFARRNIVPHAATAGACNDEPKKQGHASTDQHAIVSIHRPDLLIPWRPTPTGIQAKMSTCSLLPSVAFDAPPKPISRQDDQLRMRDGVDRRNGRTRASEGRSPLPRRRHHSGIVHAVKGQSCNFAK